MSRALSWLCAAACAAAQTPAHLPSADPLRAEQSAPDRVADRLLAGDASGAAAVAAAIADDAARGRLQAALLPLRQRPAALLAVARAFPNAPAADATLRACAAAILLLQGRSELLPEFAAFSEALGDEF